MRHVDEHDQGSASLPTSERMATLARATADAAKHALQGEHETNEGARHLVPMAQARAIVESWPDAPRNGARQMLEQYGPPNEATPTKLFWYNRGPWKRIQATSDVLIHNFPAPHSDYLTMWIDYRVPVDMVDAITRYDGSCLVDRTAGEAAARCDSEAANTITLNLMHEIVTGKRTVEEAREVYAENMAAYTMGRSAPYAERLLFPLPQGGTEDPDEGNMGPAVIRQGAGKIKDLLTGTEGGPSAG